MGLSMILECLMSWANKLEIQIFIQQENSIEKRITILKNSEVRVKTKITSKLLENRKKWKPVLSIISKKNKFVKLGVVTRVIFIEKKDQNISSKMSQRIQKVIKTCKIASKIFKWGSWGNFWWPK